jgi:hypothetical protein
LPKFVVEIFIGAFRNHMVNKGLVQRAFGEIGVEVIARTSVYPLTVGDNPNSVQSRPNFAKPLGRTLAVMRG